MTLIERLRDAVLDGIDEGLHFDDMRWDAADRIAELEAKLDKVRVDFCMFWKAQGCSCCEDTEASEKYGKRLAELLNIPLFDDNSGVNYYSVCESALGDEDGD